MSEKPQKTPWLAKLLPVLLDPKILIPLLAALFGGGGWAIADAGGTRTVTTDTVRAIADSAAEAKVAPVKEELGKMRDENRAAFGALMQAIPAFKRAVEERGQANAETARKKAETEQLLNDLNGGSPR